MAGLVRTLMNVLTGSGGAESVHASELAERLSEMSGAVLVDVRTASEWARGHHPDAKHIELQTLPSRLNELPQDKATPIFCVCASGMRSRAACGMLARAGYEQVFNVGGGMGAYRGKVVRK